ncbi:LptA/OstA family protein [Phenylobacterium sp.]|uniref:LptA/OstA family protein n=1 Tax=Phenylobacterium sp. TaxID=1871053 RepID=UPI002736480E|nr:LptA/OstA family protein [Phenylobacterium sp.]MDP3853029.1 LptA/OstA family protein [Phenylobacterium sp.]
MSKLETIRWAAGACALVLLAAGPASAQLSQNADAPVDITADALEVVNTQCLSIWSGSAEALQDRTRLRADVLKTYNKKAPAKGGAKGASCGALDRMEAIGNVYYVTPQQRVRGDAADYDVAGETIVITGDVVAVNGQNVLRGERLTVNVATGDAQMEANSKGRAGKARPRAVIYPSQQPAGQSAQRR